MPAPRGELIRRAGLLGSGIAEAYRTTQAGTERPVLVSVRINRRDELSALLRLGSLPLDQCGPLALQSIRPRRRTVEMTTRWAHRGEDSFAVATLPDMRSDRHKWRLVLRTGRRFAPVSSESPRVADLVWTSTGGKTDLVRAQAHVDEDSNFVLSDLSPVAASRPHTASFGIGTAEVTWVGDEKFLVLAAPSWSVSTNQLALESRASGTGRRTASIELEELPSIDTGEWVCAVGDTIGSAVRLRCEPGVSPRTDRVPRVITTQFTDESGDGIQARFRYTGTHQLCLVLLKPV